MMSSLQMALLLCGVAVVVAVLIYNRWVTRRAMPKRASASRETVQADADSGDLPFGHRTEPSLDGAHPFAGHDTVASPSALPTAAATQGLDPLLDVVVPLTSDAVVSGDAVLAALPGTRRIGQKAMLIEGFHASRAVWEPPAPGHRYSRLQAGVQLANRHGPLNEIEFSEFVVKLQSLADSLQLDADFPEMKPEVARARELDQFAADHDAQLSFVVRATRAAWSPGYVMQHAAGHGFVAGAMPGRMVLPGAQPGEAPVLVLQFDTQAALSEDPDHAAIREFTVSLDVPHVARTERPFVRLREAAIHLARAMEGAVTDDAAHLIGSDAMDRIGADLEQLYDALDARGLPAGSPLARRLFS